MFKEQGEPKEEPNEQWSMDVQNGPLIDKVKKLAERLELQIINSAPSKMLKEFTEISFSGSEENKAKFYEESQTIMDASSKLETKE
jgi:hypothetical protein